MQTNGTADEEAQMSIMREHLLNAGLHVEGELLFFCTEESSLSRYWGRLLSGWMIIALIIEIVVFVWLRLCECNCVLVSRRQRSVIAHEECLHLHPVSWYITKQIPPF